MTYFEVGILNSRLWNISTWHLFGPTVFSMLQKNLRKSYFICSV